MNATAAVDSKGNYLKELFARHGSRLHKENEPGAQSNEFISHKILEEELMRVRNVDAEKTKIIEKELIAAYNRRGYSEADVEKLLKAQSEGNNDEYRQIVLKHAKDFEGHQKFVWAAEEYFEAGDFKKAAEIWAQAGREGVCDGKEFLYAAECLIKTGIESKEAYRQMAEEARKLIAEKKKEYGWSTRDLAHDTLGMCLHYAGDKEGALEAFGKIGSDPYDNLKSKINYLVWIEDWEGAVKLEKELLSLDGGPNSYYHLERIVEYSKKAGMRSEGAKALWRLGRFMDAARIVYDITKNKTIFFDAAQAYSKRGSPLEAEFFRYVLKDAREGILYRISKGEKGLEQLNKTIGLIHAAYELPVPPINKGVLSLSETENRRLANELYKEFLQKKKKTKKRGLPKLLSEFILYRALEHALAGGSKSYRMEEALKGGFAGMPWKRPVISSLPPELKKIWQDNLDEDTCDNVLMAAKAFEEGGYYKEAKGSYLKASLLGDAARMEKLIEEGKVQSSPKV